MEYIMTTLLLMLINSAGDRLRGTGAPTYQAGAITAGTIFTLCMAWYMPNGWQVLIIDGWGLLLIAAYVLGEAPGWGCPLGAYLEDKPMHGWDLEWWQFGPLKRTPGPALVFRGLMWGAPIAGVIWYLFDWHYAVVVLLAYAWSMITGPMLASGNWERMESIRGALVIVLICVGVLAVEWWIL